MKEFAKSTPVNVANELQGSGTEGPGMSQGPPFLHSVLFLNT